MKDTKKMLSSIKGMLNNIVDEKTANDIFEANFPKLSKEEVKKQKDHERVMQIMEYLKESPNKITPKMIKDFKKITGLSINKSKHSK